MVLWASGCGLGCDVRCLLDRVNDHADLEGLLEEPVEPGAAESLGLPVRELARHTDQAGHLHRFARANELGDLTRLALGDVDIDQHDMRAEPLALEPGAEGGVRCGYLVARLVHQDPLEDIRDLTIRVDDQDAGIARGDPVHRDVMRFHEPVQFRDGDPPVLGPGDAIPLELTRVEPLGHRPGGDIADLGNFACCKHIFFYWHHLTSDTDLKWSGTILTRHINRFIVARALLLDACDELASDSGKSRISGRAGAQFLDSGWSPVPDKSLWTPMSLL